MNPASDAQASARTDEKLTCHGRARLSLGSTHDAWEVVEDTNPATRAREVDVQLEIQGNGEGGYFLLMAPEGCFTADNWYRTKEEALEDALRLFGVPTDGWKSER